MYMYMYIVYTVYRETGTLYCFLYIHHVHVYIVCVLRLCLLWSFVLLTYSLLS